MNIAIFIITISKAEVNVLYCDCRKKTARGKDDTMGEPMEILLMGMTDAGCTKEEIKRAVCFLEAGSMIKLTRFLRQCRCSLMEQMHESQKRVDRMDYLIRQSKKLMAK